VVRLRRDANEEKQYDAYNMRTPLSIYVYMIASVSSEGSWQTGEPLSL